MRAQQEAVWIIRWDRPVKWPDGLETDMYAKRGTKEEAERFAGEVAAKYGLKVEAVV